MTLDSIRNSCDVYHNKDEVLIRCGSHIPVDAMLFRKPFLLLNSAKRTRMRPPLMRLTPMFYISPQISTSVCTLQASWCINSSLSYFLIELEEKVCDLKTCYNMRCIFNLLRTVFAMSHVLCLLSRNKCCWLRRCRKHNPWENTQIDKSVLLVTKIYLHCRSLL